MDCENSVRCVLPVCGVAKKKRIDCPVLVGLISLWHTPELQSRTPSSQNLLITDNSVWRRKAGWRYYQHLKHQLFCYSIDGSKHLFKITFE